MTAQREPNDRLLPINKKVEDPFGKESLGLPKRCTPCRDSKYPEVWFMYDGAGSFLGYIGANPPERHPDKYHIVVSAGLPGYPNPYFDELERIMVTLGPEIYDLPKMFDGKRGGVLIAPVDKEESLATLTNAGFMATRAQTADHEAILREIEKLPTIED